AVVGKTVDVNIYGTTADGWEYIRDFLRQNLVEQRDLGTSVAIYHEGKLVVDLWGGWFDQTQVKPYDNDTLQLVGSCCCGLGFSEGLEGFSAGSFGFLGTQIASS
ncbi:unnamed protein product, partial [Didymodactylos carnosus]